MPQWSSFLPLLRPDFISQKYTDIQKHFTFTHKLNANINVYFIVWLLQFNNFTVKYKYLTKYCTLICQLLGFFNSDHLMAADAVIFNNSFPVRFECSI